MRVPYTKEMAEIENKIEPYLVIDGLVCVLSPNAPDDIKERDKKLDKLFKEQYDLCIDNYIKFRD